LPETNPQCVSEIGGPIKPKIRRTTVKGTRHSEEQIIAILKQGEAGLTCPPSID